MGDWKAAYDLANHKSSASIGNATNTQNSLIFTPTPNPNQGVNLYNFASAISGNYINWVDGSVQTNASYYASDYISVKALTSYQRQNNIHIAYYNSAKTFLSGAQFSGMLFTTPVNCAYIRVSIPNANYTTEQITEVVPSSSIVPTIQFQFGKNLFNPATIQNGYYVSETNGLLGANPSYYVTDFIPVNPLTAYTASLSSPHMAFYDTNQNWISGLAGSGTTFVTPAGCYFMRLSYTGSISSTMQIEEGSGATSYEPYKFTTNHSVLTTYHDIKLSLPDILPVVVGREINIYKTNIMHVDNISNYQVTFTCNVGKHQNERWTYVPVAGDVGDHTMTVSVYQKFNLIAQATTTIRVLATAKAGSFKVLIIGDSTTANNVMINQLANVLTGDALTITFLGTQGTAPNKHEGRSGWSTNQYYTDPTSPFVFSGSFNFAQYLSTNAIATPDIVVINLGINDLFPYTDDASSLNAIGTMISQYDAMITNIKASNANVKIGIGVTIPSGQQDAFGFSYGAGQTSWRYNRNNRILTKVITDYYRGKQGSNIYLLPLNTNLDTVNNIATDAAAPVNSQNTAVTVVRQNNGVHPGTYGYYQIADVYYNWLKSFGA